MYSLYFIIIIVCIVFWFLASGLYKPLGKFISKIIKDSIENMIEEDKEDKKDE